MKGGIPTQDISDEAEDWTRELDNYDLDARIVDMEAAQIVKRYNRQHVPELGGMKEEKQAGVFRLMGGQLNSASTKEVRDIKIAQIETIWDKYDVDLSCFQEICQNWSAFPPSYRLSSWFKATRLVKAHTSHNTNPGENVGKYQPGGCGMVAMGSIQQYIRKSCSDFRHLGRWDSWLIYATPTHRTRVVTAYNVGRGSPKGVATVYQQTLRYIQNNDLDTTPRELFKIDFLAILQTWQEQGDRLLVFVDMNEHILKGPLAKHLMGPGLNLLEATHTHWVGEEPHTFVGGSEPIDAVYYSDKLEITSTKQLSFHQSVGDHRTSLIDVTTRSMIGKNEFKVERVSARKLSTKNKKSTQKYISKVEEQLSYHKLQLRLDKCTEAVHLANDIASPAVTAELEVIDRQTVEIQVHAESKCRRLIDHNNMPFTDTVQTWVNRKRVYQGLVRRHEGKCRNQSNLVKFAWKMEIEHPKSLTKKQCQDGVRYCKLQLMDLRKNARGLRKVFLRDRLVAAKAIGDEEQCKGVQRTMEQEEQKHMWFTINRSLDDPRLGATMKVQKVVNGEVVEIDNKEAMNAEIQLVTEKRFDLAHSAKITLSSLQEKLGYLSDTEFAKELLGGEAVIPADVDETTTMVLEEIGRLGMEIQNEDGQKFTITPTQFKYFWRKVKESTSSSTSTVHYGHYKAATDSPIITKFLTQKLTVVARCGRPPERWGVGLQVMLEKIAGVALVNKLRAILLMEGDYNYFNKWAFGREAINVLYEMGYIPEDQYSQKESTAEDAKMDNRLTMDISRQTRHPMASTSADAANCYDRINHIIMAYLLLAITGSVGLITALLFPIQIMKFFQRTGHGDSTTFMGGPNRAMNRLLQGLCQGNGAAPACWLMLSSVLMHCYEREGHGSSVLSPMSMTLIEFLGSMFVDDTDIVVSLPELRDSLAVYNEMQSSMTCWGSLLCSTGGALKPEKCYWYMIDYECVEGEWDYAPMKHFDLSIPLPDDSMVGIQQLDVNEPREMLGVWSCPAGTDDKHLEEKVLGRMQKFITRVTNGHLPSKFAWVAYQFKLWPGLRYGMATLSTSMETATNLFSKMNYTILPLLGVNRNIKTGWRTLPRAFGGIGLFSFPIEQMICWLNMITQHFGVPSTLGRKFQASLEALQLEIGSQGNPLEESFEQRGELATMCWFRTFWERLECYDFTIYLEYQNLTLPRRGDVMLVTLFLDKGATGRKLISLNRCRLANQLLYLSDMVSANGRRLEKALTLPPTDDTRCSRFNFPREEPTDEDWIVWLEFWAQVTDAGGLLRQPLGQWLAPTHRIWHWFYDATTDVVTQVLDDRSNYYHLSATATRTRGGQRYERIQTGPVGPPAGVPVSVTVETTRYIIRHEVGGELATSPTQPDNFWAFLRSWGGEWMWNSIEDENQDLTWLVDALRNNTALLVTDGSYDRKKAPHTSGAGWIICCTRAHNMLRGSFYETSPSASAYRGELLGLVALHTLALALTKFYNLGKGMGKVCCDNIAALNQSSWRRRRIKTGQKQADLLRSIRTLKLDQLLKLTYEHVDAHQDRIKLWRHLTLEEQINVKCDELAKSAVHRSMIQVAPENRGKQLLPLEKAAVFVNNIKLTTDVAKEVRFCLGEVEARKFYTGRIQKKGGGLGWSATRFAQVEWKAINAALASKPDMYGIWLAKQASGWCATRKNVARIQDSLDDKCPNCQQHQETSSHLNRCPDNGRTLLFKEGVEKLAAWMNQDNRTDPALAYWIEKYLLLRGCNSFASMGTMNTSLRQAAESQDLIGWVEFLHGKVSVEIAKLQRFHCAASPCRMNGTDWMKHFVSHLLHISHSQWLYRNFTLHDTTRGYLRLKERQNVLIQIDQLLEVDPNNIPAESRFLLEMDFDGLYQSSFEKQAYWVVAMKAAYRAGRRTALVRRRQRASSKRRAASSRRPRSTLDNAAVMQQIHEEQGLRPPPSRSRPHPSSIEAQLKSNKRLKHPD